MHALAGRNTTILLTDPLSLLLPASDLRCPTARGGIQGGDGSAENLSSVDPVHALSFPRSQPAIDSPPGKKINQSVECCQSDLKRLIQPRMHIRRAKQFSEQHRQKQAPWCSHKYRPHAHKCTLSSERHDKRQGKKNRVDGRQNYPEFHVAGSNNRLTIESCGPSRMNASVNHWS